MRLETLNMFNRQYTFLLRKSRDRYYLPLCFSFLFCCFNSNCRCFSASRCSRLIVLRSLFNCSCCNFKACCDFVPIPIFCTCFRTSLCIRFGLRPVSFYISCHSRTKFQPIVIFQNKIIYLIVFWFRTKCNLAYRELSLRYTFKNAYPEWFLKKYCQSA